MKLAKLVAWLGFIAMSIVLIYGFTVGDFSRDGGEVLRNPWGIVSIVDLYSGFFIFSIWIVYREKTWWKAGLWIMLMIVLGFWAGSLYTLLALYTAQNHWEKFWLGSR
ncbi:MAG: DUF1475 family protein [Anaerolineaceae bacterium]|nr:DUF1475 family protein [Anaerolineaceae bacterium]